MTAAAAPAPENDTISFFGHQQHSTSSSSWCNPLTANNCSGNTTTATNIVTTTTSTITPATTTTTTMTTTQSTATTGLLQPLSGDHELLRRLQLYLLVPFVARPPPAPARQLLHQLQRRLRRFDGRRVRRGRRGSVVVMLQRTATVEVVPHRTVDAAPRRPQQAPRICGLQLGAHPHQLFDGGIVAAAASVVVILITEGVPFSAGQYYNSAVTAVAVAVAVAVVSWLGVAVQYYGSRR
jgi:hypothetical protein